MLGAMNSYQHYKQLGEPIEYLMSCWARTRGSDSDYTEYGWADVVLSSDVKDDPERAWECIMHAVAQPGYDKHFGVLAAGPLENLLSFHGDSFIDRVETTARQNPHFAFLLGGVWQFKMTDGIWERVQKVWDRQGWDNVPRGA